MYAATTWKPVPDSPEYFVASDGRIWSQQSRRVLSPRKGNREGHLKINLGRQRDEWVHRLVALVFLGPPPDPRCVVMHRDGNPTNNCVSNLCWGTESENLLHRYHGGVWNGSRIAADECDVPF